MLVYNNFYVDFFIKFLLINVFFVMLLIGNFLMRDEFIFKCEIC